MASIDRNSMQHFLSKSISSINSNKINGMLAEIDLRNWLNEIGYGQRISQGGWIFRNVGEGIFGHHASVLFPQTIEMGIDYNSDTTLLEPPIALHTICATMHQIGVRSFHCVPFIEKPNDCSSIDWRIRQLGIPTSQPYESLVSTQEAFFGSRTRRYNFLKYNTDAERVPLSALAEEFTKEHLRVSFQSKFMSEPSDIDGILWGQQYTYPLEIKEKTVAHDTKVGYYFGIDVGPFVKLAYYAAKKGNLHSLFIVKEINNIEDRELVNWWYITFDTLAQFASWIPQEGGKGMMGGRATVVKVPRSEFKLLTKENLDRL